MTTWIIKNEGAFWSNENGWGDSGDATRFSDAEKAAFELPTDGEWVEDRPKRRFQQSETQACYVTFISQVDAFDEDEAREIFEIGGGESITHRVGDSIGFLDHTTIEISEVVPVKAVEG